jgi:predicted PurR-regulated permease PerM
MLGIDERALRIAWTIFLFGLLLVVVYYIRGTILLFAGSIFLAYMLSPIVELVERFIPQRRNLALALVYIVLIGLLVLLGFELVPALNAEATSLFTRLPSLVSGGSLAQIPLPQGWSRAHDHGAYPPRHSSGFEELHSCPGIALRCIVLCLVDIF